MSDQNGQNGVHPRPSAPAPIGDATTRRMEARPALEVYLSEKGHVCILQEGEGYDDCVTLEPAQVPVVIQWLLELVPPPSLGRPVVPMYDSVRLLREIADALDGDSNGIDFVGLGELSAHADQLRALAVWAERLLAAQPQVTASSDSAH